MAAETKRKDRNVSNENGSMWKWAFFMVCVVCACVGFGLWARAARDASVANAENAVTPVECTCSCPQPKCTSGQGMVIDGYNVTVALDGTTKWLPPSLNPEESGYVVLCRREDPELVDHPDYTMTKLYNYFHECLDEIATLRAGYDDDVNQCCWQENSFELPLPEPIRVPHQMTEAEYQEELNSLVGPNGEKYR